MGFIKEFRDFAVKGNLVDIAVAFVMGAAFSKVVSALTEGIVAPLIGLIGGKDLSDLSYTIKPQEVDASGEIVTEAVLVNYGVFLTACIDFILVAFVMFLIIKAINTMKRKEPPAEPVISSTDILLAEIRDELRKS